MTSAKRTHIFEIVDEFDSSEETLFAIAQDDAKVRAGMYGWELVSVGRSDKGPVREGIEIRHFFEMTGTEVSTAGAGLDHEQSQPVSAPYKKAAKEANL